MKKNSSPKVTMDEVEHVEHEQQIKLYPIRWWIAILIAIDSIVLRIVKNSFGLVNNVFTVYFDVNNLVVDWFTLIQIPGMVISSLFLAPTIYHNLLQFRKLSISMAGSITFACICLLVAYTYPSLHPFIFVGEFAVGFAVVTMDVVSASFAISWFPEHQIGLALSIKGIFGNTGSLLAYLIPSNLLISPPSNFTAFHQNEFKWNETSNYLDWFYQNQVRLIVYTLAIFTISFVVMLFFIAFSSDKPPTPPTAAQAPLRLDQKYKPENKLADVTCNSKEFYSECIRVIKNKAVLQVAIVFSITQGCNFIQKLFMGEILRKVFTELGHIQNANIMSGYVLVSFEFGCVAGSVVSGKVVDHYKDYRIQLIVDLLLCFISTIGILIGYYFLNAKIIYISNTLFGFSITYLVTPIFEAVYQHMYPLDPGFVTLILRIECSFGIIFIGQTCRLWLDLLGGVAVLSYVTIILFVALIISLFLKPNYGRLNAESRLKSGSEKSDSEKTFLLDNKTEK